MKTRLCAALLLAALAVSIFSGCSVRALQQLDQAEDAIDHRMDIAEEKIENRIESMITESAVPAAPVPDATPTEPRATSPRQITKEEAISIALNHANLTEDQVTRLRTEFDYDDGRPEYEVDFHHGGYEYDYEIHAETGAILSFDKDRED